MPPVPRATATLLDDRGQFHAELSRHLAFASHPAPPLAVLYVGLDGLEILADRDGSSAGVLALGAVAARLLQALQRQDTVCPLGDGFACMVPAPEGRRQMGPLMRRLLDVVAAPLPWGAVWAGVQPRVGIAMFPVDGSTSGALLRRAQAAMRRASREHLALACFERGVDL